MNLERGHIDPNRICQRLSIVQVDRNVFIQRSTCDRIHPFDGNDDQTDR